MYLQWSTVSLSVSWSGQDGHSDWLLPDETLPLHGRWGHCLDPDLQTRLCNWTTAELPGRVSHDWHRDDDFLWHKHQLRVFCFIYLHNTNYYIWVNKRWMWGGTHKGSDQSQITGIRSGSDQSQITESDQGSNHRDQIRVRSGSDQGSDHVDYVNFNIHSAEQWKCVPLLTNRSRHQSV